MLAVLWASAWSCEQSDILSGLSLQMWCCGRDFDGRELFLVRAFALTYSVTYPFTFVLVTLCIFLGFGASLIACPPKHMTLTLSRGT